MSILSLENVSKKFGDYTAVNGFTFSINEGELRCLLGPNGAGKTTCMDLITGRQKVSGGKIRFAGKNITHAHEHDIVRRGIGRKFQVPAVFQDLSVEENFEVAMNHGKGPFSNMTLFKGSRGKQEFERIIELTGLKDRLKVDAGLLSHGETQWLEIGMVLMQDPKLLLMDEPTAGMTEQETEKTSEIFLRLKESHTLIVVEHDMSFVRSIADVVTVMHMGSMLAEGRSPRSKQTRRCATSTWAARRGIDMLNLKNVTSYYGKTPILQDISFDVGDGECICVLGRNGVGKTTLMQTIMGLTTRATGEIAINGKPMIQAITANRAEAGLGYVNCPPPCGFATSRKPSAGSKHSSRWISRCDRVRCIASPGKTGVGSRRSSKL